MKPKRRAVQVPPNIRSFIDSVIAVPLESIEEPLKHFVWAFDKGDFHHWVDLFNHFDTFFEKYIKLRKDLLLEDDFLDSDSLFPKAAVLQILRVIRVILENCTNKHFYSSYEQHLSALLASTDVDVVEACLQTLAAFLKKTIGKCFIRDASLKSKLYAFAQGWGVKEEGLGLVACALEEGCSPGTRVLGRDLYYEFYAVSESASGHLSEEESPQGLQIIHLPNIGSSPEGDLELLHSLIREYKVPSDLSFSLLTRLRFARAFGSLASRQQYTCIRLYAFVVLAEASKADDLVSFFNAEPEFINELLTLLSYEDDVPEKIRTLCLFSLVALCQDRSRQLSILSAVTIGGHRGILSSLVQKAIESVISGSSSSKWSVVFAEALLSLVTALVTSSEGIAVMRDGFTATLLPLLKDTNPQHSHLVSTSVHILEAFMEYSSPAAALFRELGGLDDTIARLGAEVLYVENGLQQNTGTSYCGGISDVISDVGNDLDDAQPLYSDALVSYHRRLLMKALLHAISLGTYAPGSSSSVYCSSESLLPHCLRIIFQRAKDFGGGVFSLATIVMSDLIHKDPTCFSLLDAAGLPSAFLDAIMGGVLCSSEAVSCIPQCLDALCLNNNGLQTVKDRNALRCFVEIFTSRSYMRALTGDTPAFVSGGLDELLRHASSLRGPGVEMLIEILTTISNIGSGTVSSSMSAESIILSNPVPMETDVEEGNSVSPGDTDALKIDNLEPLPDSSSTANIEGFLPDCVNNAARLLETVLQNSETCRIFVEKKGMEAVLHLLTLPLMPLSASLGYSLSVALKNFSLQQSGSLARAVCTFLREHSKATNDLLASVGGVQLITADSANQAKVSRHLFILEGVLSLSIFLLKRTTTALSSELGSGDADAVKELGRVYQEVIWQISSCRDSKADKEKAVEQELENADAGPSNPTVGRESDDDANIPAVTGSQSLWVGGVGRSDSLHRRSRHGFSRIRGGRTGSHFEALEIESQIDVLETSSVSMKQTSPDVLVLEMLVRLASRLRSFFTAIVKGFTSSNRRRGDSGSLGSASKVLGSALAKMFFEALGFSGHCNSERLDASVSVKCSYLGKVVDDMAVLSFDSRRRTCYASMINNFYVHGTFKELLTTFEATSQLLWTPPYSAPTPVTWLRDTLKSYCRELEYFVNAAFLLSPASTAQAQLVVQPVTTGLSIGLFPVPKSPDAFVQMLQCQVRDVILPVWNHPMFPNCSPDFVASVVSLVTHTYSGVDDLKRSRSGITGSSNQPPHMPPLPDEATVATIVEMGFTRARAEEALRRVRRNNVEMAMEWLFSHPEDNTVQEEDDELAQALAFSLGSSSEATPKPDDAVDKSLDVVADANQTEAPPVDDILSAMVKLLPSSDVLAFPLIDLLVTLCSRNKGEGRPKVIAFLTQQLKTYGQDFSRDSGALCMISHVIALVLSEDGSTREIASQNGIVSVAIDIIMNLKARNEWTDEAMVSKCISLLLLILDNMLQPRLAVLSKNSEGKSTGALTDSSPEKASLSVPSSISVKAVSEVNGVESGTSLEEIFGNSTGYLSMEESHKLTQVACDLIKQQVPSLVMQAVLQLCARLTKTHALALDFLENGALAALLSLPRGYFFSGYVTVASAIIRHLLEDPRTLQTAMELDIRQTLSGNTHAGGISPRTFLTSTAAVITRDPVVFMRAAAAVCEIESSGGRTSVVLLKVKDKPKASAAEAGLVLNDSGKLPENKTQDGSVKCTKGYKKVPANLTQVIDQLLDIVLNFPSSKTEGSCESDTTLMEVDEPGTKLKGKSTVDFISGVDSESARSAELARVTFVLKLLGDILLMYPHAFGVILKRDLVLNQLDGSGRYGILHHVLHNLVPLSADKSAGPGEWRDKLSEKASWFLVVLCGRSSEGRRRVVTDLVKTFSSFANLESNSSRRTFLPTDKIFSFADLAYSVLSKNINSSPSNLPGSCCSADVAKSMIDGGMVQCLAEVLQVIDLDHPNAPKMVNLTVKFLESLTRFANIKSDVSNKKNTGQVAAHSPAVVETQEQLHQQSPRHEGNAHDSDFEQSAGEEVRNGVGETSPAAADLGMDFMQEEMEEEGGTPQNHIEVTFHVDVRGGDDDDDDDMAEDDEEDDDDDNGREDEDEAEDGTRLMSLADTDGEDHDYNGMGDDFNDEMVDEGEGDDFHENHPVIEVRWREVLDGLHHRIQVLSQHGAANGLIDVAAEPFEGGGVNVDDLIGVRRSLGFERRRQTLRSSSDRSTTTEASGFQHPLLIRPNQSGSSVVSLSSSGGNLSRDFEAALSSEGIDASSNFYMLDAPVLPYDNVPSTLLSGLASSLPPPLADYSVGLESLQLPRPGNGRWTDNGQPHAGFQAAAVAQAVEEQFLSQLRRTTPSERQLDNSGVQERQLPDAPGGESQLTVEGDASGSHQSEDQHLEIDNEAGDQQRNLSNGEVNLSVESNPCQEQVSPESAAEESMSIQPLSLDNTLNRHDSMDIGNGGSRTREAGTPMDFAPANISVDVDINDIDLEENENEQSEAAAGSGEAELSSGQEVLVGQNADHPEQTGLSGEVGDGNADIDPTFLEALPEDLRAEVLASRQVQTVQPSAYVPPSADEIDPEFLAALPPEIQAEVLAQQRAQRVTQQAQPIDMDNASIIATLPADLREEVLLNSSEAVLSALPSQLIAEARMLIDRERSHYQARSLLGSNNHRLHSRRSGLGFDWQSALDRGVGVTIGQRAGSIVSDGSKGQEFDGEPLLDPKALKALIRLLRLAQPLSKGLLQRLLLNLCAHSITRADLVLLLLSMMKPNTEGSEIGLGTSNSQRLYGCQSNIFYSRSQLLDGLSPLVLRRILEILTYLATNHSAVASMLFYFDPSILSEASRVTSLESKSFKGKEKVIEGELSDLSQDCQGNVPLTLFLKLLDKSLLSRSTTPHLEQVLSLIQVVVHGAASKLESQLQSEQAISDDPTLPEQLTEAKKAEPSSDQLNNNNKNREDTSSTAGTSSSEGKMSVNIHDVFLQLPQSDLCNICNLICHKGLSDKVYLLASKVLKKLAEVVAPHRKLFILELSELAHDLCGPAVDELVTLRNTHMLGVRAGFMSGDAILRVIQALGSLSSGIDADSKQEEQGTLWKLNAALESLWQELSNCVGLTESQLGQSSQISPMSDINVMDHAPGAAASSPLPPGTQRLLPYIEAFFVLSEKLQASDHVDISAFEVKDYGGGASSSSTTKCGGDSQKKMEGTVTFVRFAEKHRRLLNAFIRQNPGLLENSLSMLLKAPRLVDFDNKRAYFRSRIRQQHDQALSGSLRISVRRAYVLEDSYNQLRMRSPQEMKGRLNVKFHGEEGIDAGGLTREWFQVLSRVIFDRGALLFTTVGNNATFQPNPNSVYQTEHLSYFKFLGRVVAKALLDGQLLDVHFTRSFYKHILGIKVTYHDIEAVDPDYYKNLKWMLENDVSDILDLTFSMDADEEKHILYEKNEVTDYELKPGGRNTRVTEETKHEYVDLVADHILTNAIRTQINSFLEGFKELVPRELISIFNDKELELLISGLPEIDLDDLKANTEYSSYTAASSVVQWFWEVVKAFSKEDMARFLQFVTGTSKVPLEGFRALQGISGPQRFQIHKAYGSPDRLPSAHTCFNQLDLPEYTSKEQLQERLLLAIHEASEGFGFG